MKRVFDEISKNIVGNNEAIFLMLVCVLAKGHVLIEDVPGVGKTLLASSLAKSCSIDFSRVQCTPDVLPSDILGFSMFDIKTSSTRYIKGPVMTNLLLVDEINRASPKTQSALLEVMEEYKVTVDGNVLTVPQPFMVIATQNPIENVGTSPLPEAQLDRFMMRISLGYPSSDNEIEMLSRFKDKTTLPQIIPVVSGEEIISLQKQVDLVTVDKSIMSYIVSIVEKTRNHPKVALGCSPRASLALMHCAQAKAFLHGRDYVIPDDIKTLSSYILPHRLVLATQTYGLSTAIHAKEIIAEIIEKTPI